ncbi:MULTISPECIES: hypothetical protein [unclassified Devosia]|uniref:hypothetical protein n=1 Tax=unclassified Devosia TaxID=196773 RepID=UPI00086E2585|nr:MULTISPECIES: hypothetical protein [unclassified Devosia]MBN9364555.1 hypothetical protein [Devosia sp.]ODS95136.1 MAG: hypothetical protein ABS47_04250 [Devosia sp. SCN 66-27]OJX25441.1 MAG: hypothetical protein BGO83_11350 [Devosia sp. 66-14]
MPSKIDLQQWVLAAVKSNGGKATIVEVSKYIWDTHEGELRSSGDLFYTWQYDMRWAAQELRRAGTFASIPASDKRHWQLK